MAGRTAVELLIDRKNELHAAIASLRSLLSSHQTELENINKALEAFEPSPGIGAHLSPNDIVSRYSGGDYIVSDFGAMSINDLILDALHTHFARGANPAMLRQVIENLYGRSIEQSSLRSQIVRLKASGMIEEGQPEGRYFLTPRGAAAAQSRQQDRLLRASHFLVSGHGVDDPSS